MKTNLQKFKDLFDEMNIKYHVYDKGIWIDDEHLRLPYIASLNIIFDDNGNFVEFDAWSSD